MGLFSSVKGLFSDKLLEEISAAYGLTPQVTVHRMGHNASSRRWTGLVLNLPVLLEPALDHSWYVTVGDLGENEGEEDSVILERFDPSEPGNEMVRDEEIDGPLALAGPAVVEQYLIGGEPDSGDYSVLKHPAVGRILPSFSAAVEMVNLYFNRHAVMINLKREGLDRATFDRDLALAVELSKALGG